MPSEFFIVKNKKKEFKKNEYNKFLKTIDIVKIELKNSFFWILNLYKPDRFLKSVGFNNG